MLYISPAALTTISCGVGSCRAMPVEASTVPTAAMVLQVGMEVQVRLEIMTTVDGIMELAEREAGHR